VLRVAITPWAHGQIGGCVLLHLGIEPPPSPTTTSLPPARGSAGCPGACAEFRSAGSVNVIATGATATSADPTRRQNAETRSPAAKPLPSGGAAHHAADLAARDERELRLHLVLAARLQKLRKRDPGGLHLDHGALPGVMKCDASGSSTTPGAARCAARSARRSGRLSSVMGLAQVLEHVERPQLARAADRPALPVLPVSRLEVRARKPAPEVLLRAPLGDHEADVSLVVGPQQLEGLEALARSTSPARFANRWANSSNRPRSTVMALILAMLMSRIVRAVSLPREIFAGVRVTPTNATARARLKQGCAEPD
jgi:hypothetical protein